MIELACIEPKIAQPNQKSKDRDCTVMAITRIPLMRSAIPIGKQKQKKTTFASDATPCGKEQHERFSVRATGGTRSVQFLHEEIWRHCGVTGRAKATIRAEDDETDQCRYHAHAQHECVPLLGLVSSIHRAASFPIRQFRCRPTLARGHLRFDFMQQQVCTVTAVTTCAYAASRRGPRRPDMPSSSSYIHACGLYNKTRVALL